MALPCCVFKSYLNNFQVATHAIGDSANRLILHTYGKYLHGQNDRHWRIEHAQVIHPDDFGLFQNIQLFLLYNGTVWFSSSAHLLGGLGRYMNGGFKFYAPGNSSLPDNLIKSIACVGDRIFVATGGTVTQQKVVEIDGNKWKLLPVAGYYLMDMDVGREGGVYA